MVAATSNDADLHNAPRQVEDSHYFLLKPKNSHDSNIINQRRTGGL